MKLLAVTVVSLALGMAVAATAYAVEAEWMLGSSTLTELSLSEEKVAISGGTVTLTVPEKAITIQCKATGGSGKLLKAGLGELSLSLKACEVLKLPCKVSEPVTIEAKTSSLLTGGLPYEVLEGTKEGKPLSTITVTGKECVLPEKSELTGKVAAQISLEESVKQALKFSEATSKAANKALKEESKAELTLQLGKSVAYLGGEPLTSLTGEKHVGEEFDDVFATKLCKEDPPARDECPAAKNYPATTTVTAEKEGSVKIVPAGMGGFICDASKLEGTLNQASGAPLLASFPTVSFTSCKRGMETCTVNTLGLPYTVQFKITALSQGPMRVLNPKFEIWCAAEMHCTYGNVPQLPSLQVTGGEPAKAVMSAFVLLNTQMGCPVTAKWEGIGTTNNVIEYKFTAPGSPAKMWPAF